MPDLVRPNLQILGANLPIQEATPIHMVGSLACSSEDPFSQLSQPQVDLSLIQECQELTLEPCDPNFLGMFRQSETLGTESTAAIPPLGLKGNAQNGSQQEGNENPPSPDIFFDEMFDYLESLPSSSELWILDAWELGVLNSNCFKFTLITVKYILLCLYLFASCNLMKRIEVPSYYTVREYRQAGSP